jgi:hypothetical protein
MCGKFLNSDKPCECGYNLNTTAALNLHYIRNPQSCYHCETVNPEFAIYCEECGNHVKEYVQCPFCGSENFEATSESGQDPKKTAKGEITGYIFGAPCFPFEPLADGTVGGSGIKINYRCKNCKKKFGVINFSSTK